MISFLNVYVTFIIIFDIFNMLDMSFIFTLISIRFSVLTSAHFLYNVVFCNYFS